MDERWLPCPGYPNYEVSSYGRVRNARRGGRLLKQVPHEESGYLRVALWNGNRRRNMRVHRLVCLAFIGPPPTRRRIEVAHIDGNLNNNTDTNVRWATRLQNEKDKLAHGTRAMGERHGRAKLSTDTVLLVLYLRQRCGMTLAAIELATGVTKSNVHRIVARGGWKHVTLQAANPLQRNDTHVG